MKKSLLTTLIASFTLSLAVQAEEATDLKVGETGYQQLCVNCHAAGVDNAPRLGEKADWLERLKVGEDTLYTAVIEGPNHMYSKGNSPMESEAQIRSMIAYMMASVTDDETKPLINTASEAEKAKHLRLVRGYKLYDLVCFSCHDTGADGAPQVGVPEQWGARKDVDLDILTDSVINGRGHMAIRAGTANHSEADYRMMTEYMLSTLEAPAEPSAAPQQDEEQAAKATVPATGSEAEQ